ncbi:MAG: thioredoxin domain-containing protein [Burkholderiaceae bacterium]|nr:thioredoxin domain-containing protein [Burkholderiaceae bacterium]
MSAVHPAATGVAAEASATVVCLCAAWCATCDAYRAAFAAAAQARPSARFVWLDIEDQEALLDGIEVENFPTLLIAAGTEVCFFGPITPQAETLARLLRAHLDEGVRAARVAPAVRALLLRLRGAAAPGG